MSERSSAAPSHSPTQKMPQAFFASNFAIGQLYTVSNIPCQQTDSKELSYKQFSHSIGKTPYVTSGRFFYIQGISITRRNK